MTKIPKPRKPGQTGGSSHNKVNRSTHASARVHQKANKSGCPSIVVGVVFVVTAVAASVAELVL